MKGFIAKGTPVALGVLFVFSGLYKLISPGEATYAVMSLDALNRFAVPIVILVTAAELYLGATLLLKVDRQVCLRGCTVLVLIFSAFLWYLLTLAHPPACGCMGLTGMFKSTKHAALFGLVRNCVILWCLKVSMDYDASQRAPGWLSSENGD